MRKILTMLLVVATVIGMVIPAMANPQKQYAVPTATKDIAIMVEGALTSTSTVDQNQEVNGDVSNWALGVGTGGNLDARSTAAGVQAVGNVDSLGGCNNGDPLATGTANGGQGSNPATANGGSTNVGAGSGNAASVGTGGNGGGAAGAGTANANSASDCSNRGNQAVNAGPTGNDNMINGPEGFSGDNIQTNTISQVATALQTTDQDLAQPVTVIDTQSATATDTASQQYIDNLLNENLTENDPVNVVH